MRALLAAVLVSIPAFAEEPAAAPAAQPAPATKEAAPAAAAPAAKEATPAPPGESRPYVEAALTFLKSFTHTNRSGPAAVEAWDALRAASAESVTIKVGGKDVTLDAKAGKTDAQLVRFARL
ncbi:MAG: hypothetical protein LC689_16675, partial [Myxococcales bacterium]|nr:hypothetical protein [Myxococcales bacterium]